VCSSNTNDYVILIDQPVGGNNLCGNGCHCCFLGLTSPEMGPRLQVSNTERHQRKRESGTVAPVANEVELIREKKLDFRSVNMALSLFSPKASSETISCCIRRGDMTIFATPVIVPLEQIAPPHEVVPAAQPLSAEEKVIGLSHFMSVESCSP